MTTRNVDQPAAVVRWVGRCATVPGAASPAELAVLWDETRSGRRNLRDLEHWLERNEFA